MSTILVIDGSAICRELLAKALETEGFSVACAPTCADALRILPDVKPGVIVLDPAAPGEGVRFLEVLRRNPGTRSLPVALLTEITDKKFVRSAGVLGVRDYILKQKFSLAELLTRVQKYVRAGPSAAADGDGAKPRGGAAPPAAATLSLPISLRPQEAAPDSAERPAVRLSREQTVARLDNFAGTRTLPGVIAEVIALVNSPRGAISDLAQVLKRDPVLAARVLHMANSAAFASQKPRISNIDEAVRNIGTGGVRGMILSVGLFESLPLAEQDKTQLLRCWQHSFAVASIMDRLVPPSDATPAGVAHLTGLCHELGEIVLRQQYPQEYAAATQRAVQTGKGFPPAISDVLGIPYQEFMSLLLTKMGLPPVITVPIEEFFDRAVRRAATGIGSVLSRALRMANVYAHGIMLAPVPDAPVTPISSAEYRNTFGAGPVPELDAVMLRSEALTQVNLLSGVSGAQAAELCRPLITAQCGRIWYCRHASYSDFDPVAALLGFAGEVEISDGLPDPLALATYDALVIAAARQDNPQVGQQEVGQIARLTAGRPLPVLYLSGVAAEALPASDQIMCRKLPISLSDAVDFLNAAAQFKSAAQTTAAA